MIESQGGERGTVLVPPSLYLNQSSRVRYDHVASHRSGSVCITHCYLLTFDNSDVFVAYQYAFRHYFPVMGQACCKANSSSVTLLRLVGQK